MTQKLYDLDSYLTTFTATVRACAPTAGGYLVTLDRTAFFPEGGGQAGDRGTLGNARVQDTREINGDIRHKTDLPLAVGDIVTGVIDFALRFDRMQNHSGEHIVSGLVHRHFGYHNVGFHLGDTEMTLDFDGVLTREQLDVIEDEANVAVFANLPITVSYPAPDALAAIPYRAKLDLTEGVRLVTIPGYDVCACCAPHVARTGEIGMIKLLDCIHYKGGVRIRMVCGRRAVADYRAKFREVAAISRLCSIPQEESAAGVERLLAELTEYKTALAAAKQELTERRVADLTPNAAGNILCFLSEFDEPTLRRTALLGAERASGVCAVFAGDDREGYRVMIAAKGQPLKAKAADLRRDLLLRGGGSDVLLQGSIPVTRAEIETYFAKPI